MPPIEYRTLARIKAAEGMLRGSYESINAFGKAFRLAAGMSSTEWAKAPELK